MGWWKTEHGVLGDEPADLVGDGLARLGSSVPPVAIVRALVDTLARDADALFDDPGEAARWSVTLEGVAPEASLPEPGVLAAVRALAGEVAACYRESWNRRPTPPELVAAFAFVLRRRDLCSTASEAVLRDPDVMVRRRFADDPRTPAPLVDALFADPSEIVRTAARRRRAREGDLVEARAPETSEQRLVELAGADEVVALAVAARPGGDAAVITALARSAHPPVRRAVARLANAPASALAMLVRDPDKDTRLAVLRHPATSHELVRAAARRGSDEQLAVCANPNAPPDVLVAIADSYGPARDAALLHRAHPLDSLQRHARDPVTKAVVARSPAVPLDLLLAFARGADRELRRALAQRHDLPEVLAEVLGSDRDADVRSVLAANARCPLLVLEVLALDTNAEVRAAAAATLARRPL